MITKEFDKKKINLYNHSGYLTGPTLLNESEISYLRNSIEETFSKKNFPKSLSIFELQNSDAIKKILSLMNSSWIIMTLKEIGNFYNSDISILPTFNIQRNNHLDRLNSRGIGWHRDCGGEMEYDYCSKKLSEKSYIFGKIGIFLQENSEYGGCIDLIPGSHKHIKNNNKILRKISHIPLKVIVKIQEKLPFIYKNLPEGFFMKCLNAKKIFDEKSAPVFFDSRILHRSSPILDKARDKVSFVKKNDDLIVETPKNKIKYALYAQFGSNIGVDSYMHDRLKRINNEKEIDQWIVEQNEVKKYYPEMYESMKKILDPALKKYI